MSVCQSSACGTFGIGRNKVNIKAEFSSHLALPLLMRNETFVDARIFLLQPRNESIMSQSPMRFEILVNGNKKAWDKDRIGYSEVVELAFPGQHSEDEVFKVTYSKGPSQNPHGSLVPGKKFFVKIKSEMVFEVTRTVQS